MRKMMRYTTLGAQEKLKARSQVRAVDLAANHLGMIFKTYVLHGGYRDGVHGIIVALFAGMHTFVKYAKVWELLQTRDKGVGGRPRGSPLHPLPTIHRHL